MPAPRGGKRFPHESRNGRRYKNQMDGLWTLTARWVFPVDAPPRPGGAVPVAGGRIAAVEPRGRRSADLDLGNAAVLPGFVNAHTHLDLTGLRGRIPPTDDFTDWLRAVI